MPWKPTQDGQAMVESSDKTWSTGEGNGKPLQYSCLENPKNCMKTVPLISLIFLKRSLVFPILLFSSISCIDLSGRLSYLSLIFGTLHSDGYIFSLLLCLSLLLFFQLFVRPPQTTILHFFFLGMILITAFCTMSWTSVHSSSGTLPIRSNPFNLFVTSTV